jgi:hypothetical protein
MPGVIGYSCETAVRDFLSFSFLAFVISCQESTLFNSKYFRYR